MQLAKITAQNLLLCKSSLSLPAFGAVLVPVVASNGLYHFVDRQGSLRTSCCGCDGCPSELCSRDGALTCIMGERARQGE
jgi:hypothetical protein